MPTRRELLTALSALTLLPRGSRRAVAQTPPPVPAVIATWDHGLAGCQRAHELLAQGRDLLDALEKGTNVVEDDPKVHSVGYGGLPNEEGVVQLDAAIMDGRTHRAGAVAALERIKNPISVARKVMERTEHVMLVGAGAGAFARKMGFKEQDLLTPEAKAKWEKMRGQASFWRAREHDTVCLLGIDKAGNLASAVSTSGLANKLAGRVGDSPILGAGSFVDNDVGAAAATGVGEFTIRTAACAQIVERMRAGADPQRACEETLDWVMRKIPALRENPDHQLAFIALDKRGRPGAAAVRKQKDRAFRYAFAAGPKPGAQMRDVRPRLP